MSPTNSHTSQSPVDSHPVSAAQSKTRETQSAAGNIYNDATQAAQKQLDAAAAGLSNVTDAVGDTAKGVAAEAQQRLDSATKAATDAAQSITELKDNLSSDTGDAVRKRLEDAQKAATDAGDQATKLTEKLQSGAVDTTGKAGESVDEQVAAATKAVSDAVETAQSAAAEVHGSASEQVNEAGKTATKAGHDVKKQLHEKTALDNLTAAAGDAAAATKVAALGASDAARARVHAGRQYVADTVVAAQDLAESSTAYVTEKLQSLTTGGDDSTATDRLAEGVENAKGQAATAAQQAADGVQFAVENPETALDEAGQQAQAAAASAQGMAQSAGDQVANVVDGGQSKSPVGAVTDAVKNGGGFVASKTQEAYTAVKGRVKEEAANAKAAKEAAQSQKQERMDEAWELQQQAREELSTSMHHMYHGANSEVQAASASMK
mmetsp:Transcript_6287/g.16245  ORF Transcript_6287/g.16245 Transcript_6287/m.16245 type:complete len:436 (-) Transcript_6287:327-1634(-)